MRSATDLNRREFIVLAGAGTAAVAATSFVRGDETTAAVTLPARALGRTNVKVPVLGLGTAPAGHRPRREAAEFYAAAITRGVNYIDTAPDFAGYGVAQKALGDIFGDTKLRNQVFLVTKCHEPNGEKAIELLKNNLAELNTERADLVYAHSIGDDKMQPSEVLGKQGVIQALFKAKQDGLCRFVGISGHNRPERFVTALEAFDIDVMMTAVNPVVRHVYDFEGRVWPVARAKNVGLVAMKVLGGQFRSKADPASQPTAKGGRVRDPQRTRECFRYALGLEGCATAVLGCYDLQELEQAIAWATEFEPLTSEEERRLTAWGREQAGEWGTVYGPVA